MSLPRPARPHEFEPADHLIVDAVGVVAERSFFAFVDPCQPPIDDGDGREWYEARVRFDDGDVTGTLACTLRSDLAQVLFDAFSGRDPASPLPPRHLLDDLIGEFSNMVCGTWLSRCGGERLFRLGRPVVHHLAHPAADQPHRRWVSLHNRPLAIDWQVGQATNEDDEATPSWP